MKRSERLCTKYGILLALDEVMTGFFRTGTWFAYQQFNIVPDIVTFAKGITCGYLPLGGVIVSGEIARFYDNHPFPCTLTNGAHPSCCAAGLAAMDEYSRLHISENVGKTAPLIAEILTNIRDRHVSAGKVRSIGLLGMIELVKDRENTSILDGEKGNVMAEIMEIFYRNGLSTYHTKNIISVSPPLIITAGELEEAFRRLDKVFGEIDRKYCC